MSSFKEKYINPFTDYGFKRLFGEEPNKYRYDIKLSDIETKKVFYDKLTFIYLEMPKFNKKATELTTRFEKWLFVLKNLHKLDKIPEELKEKIFLKLFKTAEIAKFTKAEHQDYEDSLKYYRDLKNSLDTAKEEGKIEGKIEIAKNMIKKGIDISLISEMTNLSIEDIKNIIETNDKL